MRIACIVEGYGEVKAVPTLLKRLHKWKTPNSAYPIIEEPIRIKRDRFINKREEFDKYLKLAALKCGGDGWILIMLDADDDCPKELGIKILNNVVECIPHCSASVVLANREYEAWFIASAKSLNGQHGFMLNSDEIENIEVIEAEGPRDAKGWVKRHMETNSYSETIDQLEFTKIMDLQEAFDKSRSFRKLCSEWEKQMRNRV